MLRRIAAARAGGPTLGALICGFIRAARIAGSPSLKTYRSKSKPLRRHWWNVRAEAVTIGQAKEYRLRRVSGQLGGRVGAFTAEIELDMAKQVLNAAVDDGAIPFNPLARLKKNKKARTTPQGSLREEHMPDVVAAAPNLLTAVYIVVTFDTGCRRNEALTIRWDDIRWDAMAIAVRKGKGGKYRQVVTTSRALEAIRRLPRVLENPFVFANPRGRSRRHYGSETINDWVRDAVLASGVERFYDGRKVRVHGLRRGHATNAVERGVDIRSVQEQLGHASLSTTEKYLDSRIDHRRREMAEKYASGLADPLGSTNLGTRLPPRRVEADASEKQATVAKILDRR